MLVHSKFPLKVLLQEKLGDTTNASSAASFEGLMYSKVILKIFCVFWRSERSHRNIQRGWKNRKKNQTGRLLWSATCYDTPDFECHSESANLKQFQQLLLNIHNFLNLVTRTVFFRTLFVEFQPWTITIPKRSFKFNPLCANPTKCSNTLKQFVVYLPTDCLNVFGHFVGLAPIALEIKHSYGYYFFFYRYFSFFELEKSDQ